MNNVVFIHTFFFQNNLMQILGLVKKLSNNKIYTVKSLYNGHS